MQQHDIQAAIRRSILTEKQAMLYYRQAAKYISDTAARRTFELLAGEEHEHAAHFYSIYRGDDIPSLETFLAKGGDSDWMSELERGELAKLDERRALTVAMAKEQQLEEHLREMAERIDDPSIRAVYLENAESTHNHYLLIESEYARLMGMVHESDMDTYVRE